MMSDKIEYKVLARKYRPSKFEDLVGQESLIEILKNSITNDRLAHAYLLTGVRGVGKTTTARLIAMSINCLDRKSDSCEPCGQCQSCNSTGKETNLDVIEMDAASNTGVDDVREIIDNVKYKPIIGKYKIFIIDEVHMLSKSAFNALLKTLEEPPGHVKFIFATTEVKKIPITVLSRCQRFDLHRIENKILSDHLFKIADLEGVKIEKDAVSLLVRSADGSARDALSLLDQAITNQSSVIDSSLVSNMLGLADKEKIFQLLENILKGNTNEALDLYRNTYDLGADVTMIFDELLNSVHFLTQMKLLPKLKDDIYYPESERIKASELSSKLSLNDLNIIWQILFTGFQELQNGIHLFQHGEMIILRIMYFFEDNNSKDSTKKNNEQKLIQTDKSITPKKLKEDNFSHKDGGLNKIKDNKSTSLKNINNKEIRIRDFRHFVEMFFVNREGLIHSKLYNDVSLVSFKEGELTLNIGNIPDLNFLRTVAKLISKWTGRIWQVHSSSSNLGKSLYEEDIINQQKEIENMKNNPDIKKILEEFPKSKIHAITELSEANNSEPVLNLKIEKE